MGQCHHKLLSSAAAVLSPVELSLPRLGSRRLVAGVNFRSDPSPALVCLPIIQSSVASIAPMADAEDGELPPLDFGARTLGDHREDMDP